MDLIIDDLNEQIKVANESSPHQLPPAEIVPVSTTSDIPSTIDSANNGDVIASNEIISTRRKTLETSDEYNTLFTKKLSNSVDLNSTFDGEGGGGGGESDVNSNNLDNNNVNKKTSVNDYDNLDYCGGLLQQNVATTTAAAISALNSPSLLLSPPLSISESPADSSFGLQNTFKVLERYIRRGYRNLNSSSYSKTRTNSSNEEAALSNSNSIDNVAGAGKDNSLASPVEGTDIPDYFSKSTKFLHSISEDGEPSFFELEFEARSRILDSMKTESPANPPPDASKEILSPMNEMLYGVKIDQGADATTVSSTSGDKPGNDECRLEQTGSYPEYLYHIARGKDGQTFVRVMDSLMLDNRRKVLCGNRVSQMTRAYDDIEAVTRLLEEKEKDLELTVQIGKELLTQNNRLENRVTELEQELKVTQENIAQQSHELHQKNELIGILTNDTDDSSENGTPTVGKSINLDLLQRRINTLEDENKSLRAETTQLVKDTDECEEQERKLMEDIANQLHSANTEYDGLSLELERYKEENRLQHEQIISLTSRLAEAEIRLHQITAENEEASSLLSITKENQNLLASELAEFKARYQEVLSLLHETQEQLRRQRKRTQPNTRSSLIPGLSVPHADSLQSELMESSLYSENSLDSGISSDRGGLMNHVPAYKKVFETVRAAKPHNTNDNFSHLGSMSMSSSSQPRMSSYVYPGGSSVTGTTQSYKNGSSLYSNLYTSSIYDNSSMGPRTMSRDSIGSDAEDGYPGQTQTGIPGAPGAKDLEAALKRLTPAEVLARRAMLSHAPAGTYSYDDAPNGMPLGCRTPDSIMSTGSSGLSNLSSNQWRLPDKLQIVKPIEGSQTLHHWSRLATPTLSGLLEERPGVTIRGGRGLDDLGLQMYSLSDVEEDEEELPGKSFQTYGCTYTYTNSTVMHPDDGTSVTFSLPQSQCSSRMTSMCNSRQPTAPPTPRASLSRRNSCSTFSVNLGLAGMLNERGIKAVTPSALNTPSGQNFSPTVTPCNSPDGSPTRSMSPEPALFAGIFASGADILRRKFVGEALLSSGLGGGLVGEQRPSRIATRNKITYSRLEKRALRSIRILEKVESVGLENIMSSSASNISPLALHGTPALYTSARPGRTASPMAQLTSLKSMNSDSPSTSNSSSNKFSNDPISAALSKGFSNDSIKTLSDGYASSDNSSISSISKQNEEKEKNSAAAMPSQTSSSSSSSNNNNNNNKMGVPVQPGTNAIDNKVRQMQRQKSRRTMMNGSGSGAQRPDLGTVRGSMRSDLGTVGNNGGSPNSNRYHSSRSNNAATAAASSRNTKPEEKSLAQGVVGTLSSLLFGRKGGLL